MIKTVPKIIIVGNVVLLVVLICSICKFVLCFGLQSFNSSGKYLIDISEDIVNPALGFLSIILLYMTLRKQTEFNTKQHEFNKRQVTTNDYEVLLKLKDNISEASSKVPINAGYEMKEAELYTGIEYIGLLNKSIHLENESLSIGESNFNILYNSMIELAELCLLFLSVLSNASLSKETKVCISELIRSNFETTYNFFVMYRNRNVNLPFIKDPDETDIFEKYADKNNEMIAKMRKMGKCFYNIETIQETASPSPGSVLSASPN